MKYILTLLVTLQFHFAYSQNGQLPQKVRTDFCKNAYINFKYGSDAFKARMIQSARNIGLNSIIDVRTAIENICNNKDLQDEFFKVIYQIGGGRDFIFSQFIGMNMTAENAKTLTDYLIKKYGVKVPEKEKVDEEYITDSTIVDKRNLLKSMYPKGQLQADSSITYQQYTVGAENNMAVYNSKVIKEFLFESSANSIDNNDDFETLAVIITTSLVKSKLEKSTPYYSAFLFKKIGENWVLFQQYHHLNVDSLIVRDVKFKIENGKNYLLFVDSADANTIKAKYFDVEDMNGTTKIMETKKGITPKGLKK